MLLLGIEYHFKMTRAKVQINKLNFKAVLIFDRNVLFTNVIDLSHNLLHNLAPQDIFISQP